MQRDAKFEYEKKLTQDAKINPKSTMHMQATRKCVATLGGWRYG